MWLSQEKHSRLNKFVLLGTMSTSQQLNKSFSFNLKLETPTRIKIKNTLLFILLYSRRFEKESKYYFTTLRPIYS